MPDTPHESVVAAQVSPGEADAALLKGAAAFANLPPTDEFVINGRGERLLVRSTWPSVGSPVRGIVLALHGYGGHSGRPPFAVLAEAVAAAGFAFVSFDFHGHGHSTGPRALIADPSHLVDDVLDTLLALYAGVGAGVGACSVARRAAAGLPLFLLGQSMGGGTALLVGSILTHGADAPASRTSCTWARASGVLSARVAPAFAGAFLLCPFVTSDASWAARTLLVGPLAAVMPTGTVPAWLVDDASAGAQIWASPDYRRFTLADGDEKNGGISYGKNICFRTLATILALGDAVCESLSGITFPISVLHDPGDAFVPVAGSRRLLAEAPSTSKAFVAVPGGLHDIAANQPLAVLRTLVDWLQARGGRRAEAGLKAPPAPIETRR